jgi:hypothetical protein
MKALQKARIGRLMSGDQPVQIDIVNSEADYLNIQMGKP